MQFNSRTINIHEPLYSQFLTKMVFDFEIVLLHYRRN